MASFFRSPLASRLLLWVGSLTLIAGIVVFMVVMFDRGNEETVQPIPPAAPVQQGAKLDQEARVIAGKFILTAVARKNLAQSWKLVHPSMKQGFTLAQWKRGEIPVTPYPVGNLKEARFKVDESTPNSLLLGVVLIPKPGAKVKAQEFDLGLKRVGNGSGRHWVVDYWMPEWSPPIPANPVN
jgi:hypothetical protein